MRHATVPRVVSHPSVRGPQSGRSNEKRRGYGHRTKSVLCGKAFTYRILPVARHQGRTTWFSTQIHLRYLLYRFQNTAGWYSRTRSSLRDLFESHRAWCERLPQRIQFARQKRYPRSTSRPLNHADSLLAASSTSTTTVSGGSR